VLRVRNEAAIPKSLGGTPCRAVQHRVGVGRTIRAGAIDFKRHAVVPMAGNGSAYHCHPDQHVIIVGYANAELMADWWPMVAMMSTDKRRSI
jgi:hypothetical protein